MYNFRINHGEDFIEAEPEISLAIKAASALFGVSGYEDIQAELCRRIQESFQDVPEKNHKKELEGAVYFPNGLVYCGTPRDTYIGHGAGYARIAPHAVLCEPWETENRNGFPDAECEQVKNRALSLSDMAMKYPAAWIQLRARQKASYAAKVCRHGIQSLPKALKKLEQTHGLMERLISEGQDPFRSISPAMLAECAENIFLFLRCILDEWCLTDEGVEAILDAARRAERTGGICYRDLMELAEACRQPFAPPGLFGFNACKWPPVPGYLQAMPDILSAVEFLYAYDKSKYLSYALERLKVTSRSYRPDRKKIEALYRHALAAWEQGKQKTA